MKKYLLAIIFLSLLLIFFGFSFSQSLEINSMAIDMEVYENNSIQIEENITTVFYDRNKHGIFRDLPKKTYFGKPIKYENISVEGAPFKIESSGDFLRIRIGDPDKYVDATESYKINYLLVIGDDRNTDLDELYFNIIGPDWEIPISNINFNIEMPKAFDESKVNFTSGNVGSITSNALDYQINGLVISGKFNDTLYPGQALTIALPLPEGYFDVEAEKNIYEELKIFYPVLFILLFVLGIFVKFKYGKNNEIFPTVEFYPPNDLTPAEIGYLYDYQVDPYDLTSMLVYWASKGYIKIIEKEEKKGVIFKKDVSHIYLEKVKDLPNTVKSFEKTYFNELFDSYAVNNVVDTEILENTFYRTINNVQSLLKHSFKNKDRRLYSKKSWLWPFVLIFINFSMLFLFFSYTLMRVIPYDTLMITALSVGISIFITVIFFTSAKAFSLVKTRLPKDRLKVLFSSILFALLGFILIGIYMWVNAFEIYLILFLVPPVSLIYISPYALKRTKFGDDILGKTLGFKNFIEQAEKDRINRLVDEDPEYFYKILPYAMVLGVTDQWARQFEDIAINEPSWYVNNTSRRFSTIYFVNHLNSTTESISKNMTASPSQSSSGGSSGGGFSGGGSGGGGGGGW
ncbi:MAG TPA: DUF2207 domain-containing protein [Clostridia bacterium]|nr:DUF2207 domain-containing protein [Clostridia bacterium]